MSSFGRPKPACSLTQGLTVPESRRRGGTETSTLCPDGQGHTTLSFKLHRRSLLGGCRLSENSGPSHPAPQKTGMTIVTLSGPQSPCLAYALCHQAQGSSKILEACLVFFQYRSFWGKNSKNLPISAGAEQRRQRLESCASHRAGLLLLTGCGCPAPAPLI